MLEKLYKYFEFSVGFYRKNMHYYNEKVCLWE